MIIVISRTRGRTPTRGKSYARPLSSGMEISNIYRERGAFTASAICHRVLLVSVERVVRAFHCHNRVGLTPGGSTLNRDPKSARFKFARAFKAARRLSSSLFIRSALQAGKQTAGCISKAFHLTLSAGLSGLAAAVGRTPTSQKENRKCPTMQWRNPK